MPHAGRLELKRSQLKNQMVSEKNAREPLTVRAASGDDAPQVTRIYVDSWNTEFVGLMPPRSVTAELVERWRQDLARLVPQRWWVAEKGSVVGFVGIGPSRDPVDPTLGELDTIAVDPGCWRGGVGRALMAVALQHLMADGYREAVLWTLAGYGQGQRFYEATGWRLDGGARAGERQIRYRRVLVA